MSNSSNKTLSLNEKFSKEAIELADNLENGAKDLLKKTENMRHSAEENIKKHPLTYVATAAVSGVVVGKILSHLKK